MRYLLFAIYNVDDRDIYYSSVHLLNIATNTGGFVRVIATFSIAIVTKWRSLIKSLLLTSRTFYLRVAGPAPQHRDGAGDRGRFQHGQDIHCHGLRRT